MANTTIDTSLATRGFLLRMGNAWFEQDELRQALDVYLKIIEEYPGSEESQTAQTTLLTIAQRYEQDGLLRLSMDVLERLEQALTAAV
ncbi:tol-pal system YbgF family protein [Methylobacter sp. S3L5C]|uniref:tetratricopeptide repeat protein n=1 Tax=Methylobacter sp. S3L5C TaxID=2839024 RepID=UPI001FAC6F26|nr:tetratricopeptide repeat protein [Methylobacter sp. S3L5C]UOA09599.1 tetratricopeptide repeat protein [Methylobacter sp. S3L5C]